MEPTEARRSIAHARAVAQDRLDSLRKQFHAIVAGSEWTTDDDEHDPEGSTIAFERAKVIGLARDAEDEVRELDAADARVTSGSYGVCERCASAIADVRLEALPAVRRCIACVRLR